ncbi:MAG: hypothetical protein Q4D21_07035 [Phascolarctobacterium sp.]|nr:hypothetical protein [Phascolarctobacterium sp.]
MNYNGLKVARVQRTLFENVFKCHLVDENNEPRAIVRVVPAIPTKMIDPSRVPEDAPDEAPFLLVIVDDADINKDNVISFEESATYALLNRFSREDFDFQHCQFYYPSPAFYFDQPDMEVEPQMFEPPMM